MTITVTQIQQGPFTATGDEQVIPYTFMTITDAEIFVFYVGDGTRVPIEDYTVTRNKNADGSAKEGGSVTLAAGAVAPGTGVFLRANPKVVRDIVWSDTGSRLRNLNDENDRQRLLFLTMEGGASGAEEALALAQQANANSEQAIERVQGVDRYVGPWDALTNTPEIVAGEGEQGDYYVVAVAGSRDVEPNPNPDADPVSWAVGDRIQFNNGAWIQVAGGVSEVVTFDNGAEQRKRLVVDKLRDLVNAQDAPDFAAARLEDAKASLESLFAVRVGLGGVVELPPGDIYVSSLTVPAGVRLVASGTKPAQNDWDRNPAKYGSTIWLAPGGTITLLNMAGIEGVRILNPDLHYPTILPGGAASATYEQVMGLANYTTGPFAGRKAGVAQFSGTAVTIGGDDTYVKDCLIIGFQWAYKSASYAPGSTQGPLPGPSRQTIDGLYLDCTNGIDITNCWDIPRVRNCNAWNFFCGHITGLQQWGLVARRGTAYKIHDKVDGLMMTNCFGLGWDFTYWFENIYAAQVTACTGDGAVDTSVAVPNGAGLITRGHVYGLHLNGVRCDGNVTNFKFQHNAGMVDGRIISGNTSNGRFIELGSTVPADFCNGVTLDVTIAGSATEGIRVRPGCRNIALTSITAYLLTDIGEIIRADDPETLKQVQVGFVNRETYGAGVHSYGYRVLDKVVAGAANDAVAEMRGAAVGPVQFAAVSGAEASVDVEARGALPDASVVNITRRTLAGVRQLLARFDANAIVPPNFLFRAATVDSLNIVAEGAAALIHLILTPKGGGAVQAAAPLFAGVDQSNFVHLRGGASAVEVRADGAGANPSLDLLGKGTGGVRIFDLSGGVKRPIARFTRSSDIAANGVIVAASDSHVTYGAEGGTTNVTTAIAGKGNGGVRIDTGPTTYENDAAAASAGIPVGSTYVMANGYLRKRLT